MSLFEPSESARELATSATHACGGAQTDVRRAAWLTAGLVTAVTVLILCFARYVPIGHYPQDFLSLLEGGYRISQGQWPHRDFSVPIGIWPLLQGYVALELAPRFVPFLTYQMTQWLTVLPIALYLALGQSKQWRAIFVLAVVAGAALIPFVTEGENVPGFSYYAGYNRLLTAFLFLTFLWAVSPRRKTWIDAGALAYLLFTMLVIKITGFVVGLGVVFAAAVFAPVKRLLLIRAALLLIAVLALLQIATGLPAAYIANIREMLGINQGGIAYFLGSTTLKALPGLVIAGVLTYAVTQRCAIPACIAALRMSPLVFLRQMRPALMIIVIILASIAAESQETGNLPLVSATALVLAPLPRRRRAPGLVHAARLAFAVLILGPWLGNIAYRSMIVAVRQLPHVFVDPALAALLPGAVTTEDEAAVAADIMRLWMLPHPPDELLHLAAEVEPAGVVALARTVDQAIVEVRRQNLLRPGMRVMTISTFDLFARQLGAPSPKGLDLAQDPNRAFKHRSLAGMRAYLANVDAAFMRICDVDSTYSPLNEAFTPALRTEFEPHDLTPCWRVWIRVRGGATEARLPRSHPS